MKHKLIKVVSPAKGTHYFTNRFKAAKWVGLSSYGINAILAGRERKEDNVKIELVDGSEVMWKDID